MRFTSADTASRPANGEVVDLGNGCLVWLRLPGGWGQTNIGLVRGGGTSLLIDTPWDQRLAGQMLTDLAQSLDRAPVSLLVNTHADPDHWWGNAELPGAEVIASATTEHAMREEQPPAQLRNTHRLMRAAARLPGRPGRTGRYVDAMLSPFDLEGVTLRYPDRTFTEREVLDVGGRDVVLVDFGAAHTSSDAVVFVPDSRIVYTGDLLFSRVTPVMWHGPVERWIAVLDSLLELQADVFVAGHGPVSGRAELTALRDYWTWLSAGVADGRRAGQGTIEIAKRLAAAAEFDAFRGWEVPERLFINVMAVEQQQAGGGPLTGPVARIRGFDGAASLCEHLGGRR